MKYALLLLVHFELLALVAISLDLLVGFAGQLHIGHIVFVGLGAYSFAYLTIEGVAFPLALAAAGGVAAVASLAVSIPACRYRSHAFVMVSLAAQVGLFAVFYNWHGFTGGPNGRGDLPKPELFGYRFADNGEIALLYGVVALALGALAAAVAFGPFGRQLRAVRDDEVAARSLGISPFRAKIGVFALASAIAGLAGAMYASAATYIDPTLYTVDEAILVLAMVLVGGSGNLVGPALGAALVIGLQEGLRALDVSTADAANLRVAVFGLALILLMRLRPQGIAGVYRLE